VPAPVSAEADYVIRHHGTAQAARAFLRDVAAGRFLVGGLTPEEHALAARLDEQYADLELGLADASQSAPGLLVPGHCTGWRARQAFAAALPDSWVRAAAALAYRLSAD
jgi:hypothetical protein